MKRSTKIIWCILAACILLGALLAGLGLALGAKRQIYVDHSGVHAAAKLNSQEQVKISESLQPITGLELDTATADVELVAGDTYRLEISYPKGDHQIKWKQQDGKLSITQDSFGESGIFFQMDLSFISHPRPGASVKIYYPGDSEIGDIIARSANGDIALNDLAAKQLDLHCSDGNIALNNVSAANAQVKTNAGDLSLNGVSSDTLVTDTSSGVITMKEVTAKQGDIQINDGNITLQDSDLGDMTSATLAGDVHIADVKAISLTGSTRNGVITLENVSAAQARLDNQDGGIAVTASEIGQLDMETSAGDIEGDDLRLENASAVTKNGMIGFNRLNAQTLHAENNDGGIAVTGGEIGALWARTLSGDVRLEQLTCAGSEVSVSSGEIVLRGAFSGENRLDNLDGSIEFDTSLPQENYAYEAETKDGTVYLNGSECGARAANTAAAANRVIANTNAGDITLSFEG